MSLGVKICGLTTEDAIAAAIEGRADFVGFVFYPPSRRAIQPERAVRIAKPLPSSIKKVGLFVDPEDQTLEETLAQMPLDIIQLHGHETPERVASVRKSTGLQVIKAIPVATQKDLALLPAYEESADYLMFDTKMDSVPSGGTGQSFDWTILSGAAIQKPWFLAGGINRSNAAQAVAVSGASLLDLSSGVEDSSGQKDPREIRAFLDYVRSLA